MSQTLKDLQSRFAIPGAVTFEEGPAGLLRAAVFSPHAEATVYVQGAHVSHYRPSGQKPLLFMSSRSLFEPGKPLRGGVPICFPWFGPRAEDPSAPLHGFARIMPWTVESTSVSADRSVTLVLTLQDGEESRRNWPFAFQCKYTVTVGPALGLTLTVSNPGPEPFSFEEALHTYLAVADVREARITGLEGVTYIDKTDGLRRKIEHDAVLRITGETDRPYLNTRGSTRIDDIAGGRRITVEKTDSLTTVVWNPWIAKAKAMPDFGDDEWTGMLCIETANALENSIMLPPGSSHTMGARISAEPV